MEGKWIKDSKKTSIHTYNEIQPNENDKNKAIPIVRKQHPQGYGMRQNEAFIQAQIDRKYSTNWHCFFYRIHLPRGNCFLSLQFVVTSVNMGFIHEAIIRKSPKTGEIMVTGCDYDYGDYGRLDHSAYSIANDSILVPRMRTNHRWVKCNPHAMARVFLRSCRLSISTHKEKTCVKN